MPKENTPGSKQVSETSQGANTTKPAVATTTSSGKNRSGKDVVVRRREPKESPCELRREPQAAERGRLTGNEDIPGAGVVL